MTPAEHLALPNVEDVRQGIIASKIAAHAADIAKGVQGAREIDDKMADARRVLDWNAQWECAIDPGDCKTDPRGAQTGARGHMFHVRKILCGAQHEQGACGEYIDIL